MRIPYLIKTYSRWLIILAKYLSALALSPLIKRTAYYRDLWIISERGIDARDNAFHLFRYIRKHHPKLHIAFIISKNSPDYPKAAALGETISYRSFRHYLAIAAAKLKISTHIMGFTTDMYFFTKLDHFGLVKGPIAFIQHGIIYDDIPMLHYSITKPDLFVTSVRQEYDFIREFFKQPEHTVQMLGLCRYDTLIKPEIPSKKILLMPTWRIDLQHVNRSQFLASEYFQTYQSLINSPLLANLLKETGYQLLFYPHYEVQKFLDVFTTPTPQVHILNFSSYDVQQLLIDADILITDFSSVFFDAAYMEKPILFYQFDQQHFWESHYHKGYFDYERDGFGTVVQTENALLDSIEALIENGAKMDPVYSARVDRFFAFKDQNNCKRNFEALAGLLKENAVWKK